jgi:ribonuclease HI
VTLLTDSQYVKTFITDTYSSLNQRMILTSQSRGAHTKTCNNDPSTTDFAEVFLDWYLIGESDAVVADNVPGQIS